MNTERGLPIDPSGVLPKRLFLLEQGWRVALKVGSEREFCYVMAPGQDYYHRLLDGEIYLFQNEEKLCMACAQRRGLLTTEPRILREPFLPIDLVTEPDDGAGFDVIPRLDDEEEDY